MLEERSTGPAGVRAGVQLSLDGEVNGWCLYQDQPFDRAVVELVVDGAVVRRVRATLYRPEQQRFFGGDGYCGFSFSVPSYRNVGVGRVILEIREQRYNSCIGRVIVGGLDERIHSRLIIAEATLAGVKRRVAERPSRDGLRVAFSALGKALCQLAQNRHRGGRTLGIPGFAASMEDVALVPTADLGWFPAPDFTIIIIADGDVATLGRCIRSAAVALSGLAIEFVVAYDEFHVDTALLPTRLRHLIVTPTVYSDPLGFRLNAAAAASRGRILAFCSVGWKQTVLRSALEAASVGDFHSCEGSGGSCALATSDESSCGSLCIIARSDFGSIGGFDYLPDDASMWSALKCKARVAKVDCFVNPPMFDT